MSHVKAENDHDSGLASNRTTYVIGTRESQLAMVQTTHVKTLLETLHPTLTFEVKGMSTTGDNIQDVALSKIDPSHSSLKSLRSLFTRKQLTW
ncbi:hypothetical protein BSLG_009920 [Batrachochytrium salamandrivorans]|nr:hypothetical protein BSLG_009920 [Batrachochytrium salamandrivorans]